MATQTKDTPTKWTVSRILTYVIYGVVLFGIILLSFRIFLLAFSANPDTPFVEFIYNTSSDFLQPFRGIFPPRPVGETGYLDVTALFAIIVYGMMAWGLTSLIAYIDKKIALDSETKK